MQRRSAQNVRSMPGRECQSGSSTRPAPHAGSSAQPMPNEPEREHFAVALPVHPTPALRADWPALARTRIPTVAWTTRTRHQPRMADAPLTLVVAGSMKSSREFDQTRAGRNFPNPCARESERTQSAPMLSRPRTLWHLNEPKPHSNANKPGGVGTRTNPRRALDEGWKDLHGVVKTRKTEPADAASCEVDRGVRDVDGQAFGSTIPAQGWLELGGLA